MTQDEGKELTEVRLAVVELRAEVAAQRAGLDVMGALLVEIAEGMSEVGAFTRDARRVANEVAQSPMVAQVAAMGEAMGMGAPTPGVLPAGFPAGVAPPRG